MNRRGFLGAILAAGIAPAIVRPGSLMRVNVRRLIVPSAEVWTVADVQGTGDLSLAALEEMVREMRASFILPGGLFLHISPARFHALTALAASPPCAAGGIEVASDLSAVDFVFLPGRRRG